MRRKVLAGLALALDVFLAYVASRPDAYRVERSRAIDAPPEAVFALVADLRAWRPWSPWEKLDPDMTRAYSPDAAGLGAWYAWSGNAQVGRGKMTVVESEPGRRLAFRLEFMEPFESTARTTFAFAPEGGGTKVTWSMDGTNDFLAKTMGVFMDFEAMIGADYERGLAALQTVAEAAHAEGAP